MDKQKPKIFLSYAHIDLGFAKKIYSDLKRYSLDIWFDKESLLPGQDWEKEINKAIRESDFFIALLSVKCLSKRGFVLSELKFGFEIVEEYFPSDSGIFIIPVRLDDCKPSDAYERLGRLHWIDVFPECEYQNGLKKILRVVCPSALCLRNQPGKFSYGDVSDMIRKNNFFDKRFNPEGQGHFHLYEMLELEGDKIIIDKKTGLIWQKAGSPEIMTYEEAKKWLKELNNKAYAGYHDWRLPSMEEAMSLIESEQKHDDLYIDPIFDKKQERIWTSDLAEEEYFAWVVYFFYGGCSTYDYFNNDGVYVRAVRSN